MTWRRQRISGGGGGGADPRRRLRFCSRVFGKTLSGFPLCDEAKKQWREPERALNPDGPEAASILGPFQTGLGQGLFD